MRKKKIEEPKVEVKVEEVVKEPIKEEPLFYIFNPTDTLESVAKRFNTTVSKLKELNGNVEISASNQMRVR